MTLQALRELAVERFGADMERATPEGVRRFVAEVREEVFPSRRIAGRFVIDDTNAGADPEAAAVAYFGRVLLLDADRAAISLWLHAVEMWFGAREVAYDERFLSLVETTGELDLDAP
jgi:hypothetical protein